MRRVLSVGTTSLLLGAATFLTATAAAAAAAAAAKTDSPYETLESLENSNVKEAFMKIRAELGNLSGDAALNEEEIAEEAAAEAAPSPPAAAPVPAGTDAAEIEAVLVSKNPPAPQQPTRSLVRGPAFLIVGVVLLAIGLTLTYKERKNPKATAQGLQDSSKIIDKVGVQSASNLAVGYMLAGLIEIFRTMHQKRQQQQQLQGQDQQGVVQGPPRLEGGLLLALAFGSFLASMAASGNLANLDYNSILSMLAGYVSKAHLGLFAAGGFELLTSVPGALRQQTLGVAGTPNAIQAQANPSQQPAAGQAEGQKAQDKQPEANLSQQPAAGQAEGQKAQEGVSLMAK